MNDPIKIIHKYKNNNKKIQYLIYIYVGKISNEIQDIIEKIKNKKLDQSFLDLEIKDIKKLEIEYGNNWYNYFFNIFHIKNIINKIKENNYLKNNILKKFGDEWYKKHIDEFLEKKEQPLYSYESKIQKIELNKLKKKAKIQITLIILIYQLKKMIF